MGKITKNSLLNPKKEVDKEWFLALLDEEKQLSYEEEHLKAVLVQLKAFYLKRIQDRIAAAKREIAELRVRDDYAAGDYRAILEWNARIAADEKKLGGYKCYFTEPYFARMDVTDEKEGYNSYYIGKKGDVNLEIVDWRAPLAVRYYQKSRVDFAINEYRYHTVLRRAIGVKNGKILSYKNEYLSVRDYLSAEEIAGRDEEILFDPYLRDIIQGRKDDDRIRDIIRTIQEKQFEIITKPERESFILQGCAGSGKTMILLHRLSYLMYNNEQLRANHVLVITPSDSFNAFIDELTQVLELQKVKTITLGGYFLQALENEGLDLKSKIGEGVESPAYLAYLYSSAFPADVKKRVFSLYEGLYGLFTGAECREVAEQVYAGCVRRRQSYAKIKNASVRVRRSVLGEMKDDGDGGFYFTKPFRALLSAFAQAEEFLSFVLNEKAVSPDVFFRQFAEFYRGAKYACLRAETVFAGAVKDLHTLYDVVSREIADLKRYRRKTGGEETFTYADRIARREELLLECEKIEAAVQGMGEGLELFAEFFGALRLSSEAREIGKCKSGADVARWLYRETVKKFKKKYGLAGVYRSDAYALCAVLAEAGRKLTPRYGLVFIDEGQDISAGEYALLKRIHADAAFNIFGDLKQNITPFRGVGEWESAGYPVYTLETNYRNTNEIVAFVSLLPDTKMNPIGLHGEEVRTLGLRQLSAYFRGKQGLKAVIAKDEYLSLFEKRGYSLLGKKGIAKNKINVMSVYESKGLEFSAVAVYDKGMNNHEKYIAYTRALSHLAVLRDE